MGLTRWRSKPASWDFRRFSGPPYPVTAAISSITGARSNCAAAGGGPAPRAGAGFSSSRSRSCGSESFSSLVSSHVSRNQLVRSA